VLNAMRRILETELKQPIRFRVDHLKIHGNWAFLGAEPQRPDGKPLDYRRTGYWAAVSSGAFDEAVHALLRKQQGGWKVVVFNLGATDVVWEPWPKEYGAPRTIFPRWDR
jgi:hypothetical protein